MKTKRLWKRDNQYYPEYVGKSFTEPEHITETVYIDLTKGGVFTPLVTAHDDQTVSIHDTVNWGSIVLTRAQAVFLVEKLNAALYRGVVQ